MTDSEQRIIFCSSDSDSWDSSTLERSKGIKCRESKLSRVSRMRLLLVFGLYIQNNVVGQASTLCSTQAKPQLISYQAHNYCTNMFIQSTCIAPYKITYSEVHPGLLISYSEHECRTLDPEWPSGLVPARHAGARVRFPVGLVYQRFISRIFTAGGSVAL